MLIPYYWAEARLQAKTPANKQVTVKRWGWSDTSQQDAQDLANRRAKDAIDRILRGEDLLRRETRDSYGLNAGVPIREEVVSRHGEIAITRNSYGALCLNTPNVFFADVDSRWNGAVRVRPLGLVLILIAGMTIGIWQDSIYLALAIILALPWLWVQANNWINHLRRPAGEAKAKQDSLDAIRAFVSKHPQWHLRVYETPAGYRLLAMHDVFDPQGELSKKALEDLQSDQRFARLCALQSCFRARVSPKYWRIGYRPKEHLPKSKWPFPPEHLAPRKRWVEGYEKLAARYASCRFVERLGSTCVHPDAELVKELHDRLCQSDSGQPLA